MAVGCKVILLLFNFLPAGYIVTILVIVGLSTCHAPAFPGPFRDISSVLIEILHFFSGPFPVCSHGTVVSHIISTVDPLFHIHHAVRSKIILLTFPLLPAGQFHSVVIEQIRFHLNILQTLQHLTFVVKIVFFPVDRHPAGLHYTVFTQIIGIFPNRQPASHFLSFSIQIMASFPVFHPAVFLPDSILIQIILSSIVFYPAGLHHTSFIKEVKISIQTLPAGQCFLIFKIFSAVQILKPAICNRSLLFEGLLNGLILHRAGMIFRNLQLAILPSKIINIPENFLIIGQFIDNCFSSCLQRITPDSCIVGAIQCIPGFHQHGSHSDSISAPDNGFFSCCRVVCTQSTILDVIMDSVLHIDRRVDLSPVCVSVFCTGARMDFVF